MTTFGVVLAVALATQTPAKPATADDYVSH
jgi:hypothetical protein